MPSLAPLMSRLSRRLADEGGNFAFLSALAMAPLLLGLGSAVDLSLFYRAQSSIQDSLDAAALAVAKQSLAGSDATQLQALAQSFFKAGTSSLDRISATVSFDGVETGADGTRTVVLTSCYSYQPYFMGIVNVSVNGMGGAPCVKAKSTVAISSTTVEIAMVLDTSGSMNDTPDAGGPTKIATLRSVAAKSVETLFGSSAGTGSKEPVRMAIVPFSGGVNVGAAYLDAWWMDPKGISPIHHENFLWKTYLNPSTNVADAKESLAYPGAWTLISDPTTFLTRQFVYRKLGSVKANWAYKGCVESRPAPYGITDEAPSEANPASLFVPYFAPDEDDGLSTVWTNSYLIDSGSGSFAARTKDMRKYFGPKQDNGLGDNYKFSPSWMCDSAPLLPLTTAKADVLAKISSLVATGSTNVAQGIEWGWHLLSRNEPFATGRTSGDESNTKAMIVMTDGEHTYYNDTYNSASSNPNISAFGAYGFSASERIFDYKSGVSTAKTAGNYTLAMDGRMGALCENAKNDGRIALTKASGEALTDSKGAVTRDGIIVYTIAFDIPASSKSRVDALLKNCASYKMADLVNTAKPYASKAKYFYSADSEADLKAAFADIMASLSDLRIVH